jgi:hypothetical protein
MTKRTRTRMARLAAAAIVVLFTALAVVACGGNGGGTSSTASGGANTYSDKTYGFSFQYPGGWEVQESGGQADVASGAAPVAGVVAYDPEGAVAGNSYADLVEVSVYKLSGFIDDSVMPQLEDEVKSVFAGLESQASDMKVLEPMAAVSFSGLDGWKITYSFDKSGVPAESTLYLMFGGNLEYQLLVQASADSWPGDQEIFQAFVSSFKPGAPATSESTSE